MAKSKVQKQELVDQYRTQLKGAKAVYLVKPKAVNPNEAASLKKALFDLDSTFTVVKNTLFKRALKDENLPDFESLSGGEHAVLFSGEEVSETAKLLSKFAKDSDKIEMVAGILNGNKISGSQVQALADLPSKEALLGQLLSVFNGPMRGLVTVLNGNARELVQVLNAVKEAKTA